MNDQKKSPKIVLITGGAGFIGSNFISYLLDQYSGFRIINFDKLTYAGNLLNLIGYENNPSYFFVKGDISNYKELKTTFEEFNPQIVVHFAAESHVDRSYLNPSQFLETNILGTQNILELSRESKVEKFIHISTDEVYGSVEEGLADERANLVPSNPYAVSKAAADLLILSANKCWNQKVDIIRSCNNFGPYQFPEKLIPMAINNLLKNADIPIYGDGNNVREWLHVRDFCRAIDKIMHAPSTGEIFNVGSDVRVSNLTLISKIKERFPESTSKIIFMPDRKAHDKRYAINSQKFIKAFQWQPLSDFNKSIENTIEWYINHREWLDDIKSGKYSKYYETEYQKKNEA
jgi:dTDP-glucose 4,6-dehydratase